MLEVDLEYPNQLHVQNISQNMLSKHCSDIVMNKSMI